MRPHAVRACAATDDVARALAEARGSGQPVAVRSGGHCFAGRSTTTGVVIDVSPMTGVEVDGDRAVIGAGTRLREVYAGLAAHGRTIAAGCGPTVGVSGLTLGGGLGILGRQHGLTCDQLLAATVVLADGQVVEADDELLWVLRGGGAPGVVTSLTFRTVPEPRSTAFRLGFPVAAAADVLDAWQHALPGLDDALAPSLVITPSSVSVFGAAPEPAAVGDLIARLGTRPCTDDRRSGTHQQTKQWLSAGDDGTPDPRWAHLHSEYFRDPVPATPLIDFLRADPRPGEERELDFSPWGGAYHRMPPDATAFPHRDARFLLKQTAYGRRPGPWLDGSHALTHPYGTGGSYPNFPDPTAPEQVYYLANTPRRARIRSHFDPDGVFS